SSDVCSSDLSPASSFPRARRNSTTTRVTATTNERRHDRRSAERVARAAHRAHRILAAMGAERLPEPPDMHVDRARVDVDVAAPDTIEQLFPAPDSPGFLHQRRQQPELGRPELQWLAAPVHPV